MLSPPLELWPQPSGWGQEQVRPWRGKGPWRVPGTMNNLPPPPGWLVGTLPGPAPPRQCLSRAPISSEWSPSLGCLIKGTMKTNLRPHHCFFFLRVCLPIGCRRSRAEQEKCTDSYVVCTTCQKLSYRFYVGVSFNPYSM